MYGKLVVSQFDWEVIKSKTMQKGFVEKGLGFRLSLHTRHPARQDTCSFFANHQTN